MKKYTQKELRNLVALGVAKDVTNAVKVTDIPEYYKQINSLLASMGVTECCFRGKVDNYTRLLLALLRYICFNALHGVVWGSTPHSARKPANGEKNV